MLKNKAFEDTCVLLRCTETEIGFYRVQMKMLILKQWVGVH